MIAALITSHHPEASQIALKSSAICFLEKAGLPPAIIESLTAACYPNWMLVGRHYVAPVNELEDLNTEALYLPWFERGYLTVGSGLNGDPIAIDLKTYRMCFIFHDEMYPRENYLPDEFVLHTQLNFSEFWSGVADDQEFPVDAYEAESCWGRPVRFQ